MYLSAVRRQRSDDQGFPWTVPVVAALESLEFVAPVTFFVGENGSGKSTVLEGIATGMRAVAVGSADIERDESLHAAKRFASGFRFERRRKPRTRLFFRAEDVFGFTRRVLRTARDLSDIEDEFRRDLPDGSYGQRLVPGGLYFLDEPEAPLSPRGVLQLIALLKDRVAHDCQFIVATHSPMLLAFPDAAIHLFDGDTIRPTPYAELEHVQMVKAFLNDPQRYLRHL